MTTKNKKENGEILVTKSQYPNSIAAIVAAGKHKLAEKKLLGLTEIVRLSRKKNLSFGFNEWIREQDGTLKGQDWLNLVRSYVSLGHMLC